ncbi:MAG TPA: hypothetical protein VLA89_13455 [Gemmatimonadales bacterium]|nr:hypothetical protein [Gemmatimonadales bacterium]
MPCDSVIRISMDLKAMNRPLLKKSLENDGWQVREVRGVIYATKNYRSVEIHPDRMVVNRGDENLKDAVYNAYGKGLLKAGIEKHGMKAKQIAANKWEITKPVFSTIKSQF